MWMSVPIPIRSLSQGIRPFVGPLVSPKVVSLRPELGALNYLRFRDPDHFRAGTILTTPGQQRARSCTLGKTFASFIR